MHYRLSSFFCVQWSFYFCFCSPSLIYHIQVTKTNTHTPPLRSMIRLRVCVNVCACDYGHTEMFCRLGSRVFFLLCSPLLFFTLSILCDAISHHRVHLVLMLPFHWTRAIETEREKKQMIFRFVLSKCRFVSKYKTKINTNADGVCLRLSSTGKRTKSTDDETRNVHFWKIISMEFFLHSAGRWCVLDDHTEKCD